MISAIKNLFATVPTIRKNVGDTMKITAFANTGELMIHSVGCFIAYPPIVSPGLILNNMSDFQKSQANIYPLNGYVYVSGDQEGESFGGDLNIISVVFSCDAPGEGLLYRIENEKAILRNADGTYILHQTAAQNAAVSIDPSEEPPIEPPTGTVVFRIVTE